MIRIMNLRERPRNPPGESAGKDQTSLIVSMTASVVKKKTLLIKSVGCIGRFVLKTAVISGIAAACWLWMLRPVYITGNQMFPALKDGDLCIAYRAGTYYTGNLIIYKHESGKIRAGRIAASGGQVIDFPENGGYTLDGYQPAEEIPYPTEKGENEGADYPLTVPEDYFFILNDFRTDENDSRSFGCISGEDIIGRVVFLLRRRGF